MSQSDSKRERSKVLFNWEIEDNRHVSSQPEKYAVCLLVPNLCCFCSKGANNTEHSLKLGNRFVMYHTASR